MCGLTCYAPTFQSEALIWLIEPSPLLLLCFHFLTVLNFGGLWTWGVLKCRNSGWKVICMSRWWVPVWLGNRIPVRAIIEKVTFVLGLTLMPLHTLNFLFWHFQVLQNIMIWRQKQVGSNGVSGILFMIEEYNHARSLNQFGGEE